MTFYDCLPGGVFRCGTEAGWPLEYGNQPFCALHGCAGADEMRAFLDGDLFRAVLPEDRDELERALRSLELDGPAAQAECRLVRRDGGMFWGHYLLRCCQDEDGRPKIFGMLADMTVKKGKSLQDSRGEECLHVLTEIGNHVIFDFDAADGSMKLCGNFEQRFGRAPRVEDFGLACAAGQEVKIQAWEQGRMPLLHGLQSRSVRKDIQLPTADGGTIWCQYQTKIFLDAQGSTVRQIGRLINMEEIRTEEAAHRRRAQRDPLTGVFHREAAQKQIERALRADAGPYIMVLTDLDDFKHINDTYGHPKGDLVLQHLAHKLEETFRCQDIIGRLGGDEFMACLCHVKSKKKVLERINELCVTAFRDFDSAQIGGESVTMSAGVVYTNRPDATFEELYVRADRALYEAKDLGKGRAYFEEW